MAGNAANVVVGAGTISVAPWISAGTGHSFVDQGVTGAFELTPKFERVKCGDGEQVWGPQRAPISSVEWTFKFKVAEGDLAKLQIFWAQPVAQYTGTAPNKTLLVGDPEEKYFAIQIVTKGISGTAQTYSTRTYTLYRCTVDPGGVKIAKGEGFEYEVSGQLLYDATLATADKFFKVVDSAGA